MNFFKFDVIKDVNVVLPEESKKLDLILNVCFDNAEIMAHQKYVQYLSNMSIIFKEPEKYYLIGIKRGKIRTMKLSNRYSMTST